MSKRCIVWKKTSWVIQTILHKICRINVGLISWKKPTLITTTIYKKNRIIQWFKLSLSYCTSFDIFSLSLSANERVYHRCFFFRYRSMIVFFWRRKPINRFFSFMKVWDQTTFKFRPNIRFCLFCPVLGRNHGKLVFVRYT
jgi:hypothetical protein